VNPQSKSVRRHSLLPQHHGGVPKPAKESPVQHLRSAVRRVAHMVHSVLQGEEGYARLGGSRDTDPWVRVHVVSSEGDTVTVEDKHGDVQTVHASRFLPYRSSGARPGEECLSLAQVIKAQHNRDPTLEVSRSQSRSPTAKRSSSALSHTSTKSTKSAAGTPSPQPSDLAPLAPVRVPAVFRGKSASPLRRKLNLGERERERSSAHIDTSQERERELSVHAPPTALSPVGVDSSATLPQNYPHLPAGLASLIEDAKPIDREVSAPFGAFMASRTYDEPPQGETAAMRSSMLQASLRDNMNASLTRSNTMSHKRLTSLPPPSTPCAPSPAAFVKSTLKQFARELEVLQERERQAKSGRQGYCRLPLMTSQAGVQGAESSEVWYKAKIYERDNTLGTVTVETCYGRTTVKASSYVSIRVAPGCAKPPTIALEQVLEADSGCSRDRPETLSLEDSILSLEDLSSRENSAAAIPSAKASPAPLLRRSTIFDGVENVITTAAVPSPKTPLGGLKALSSSFTSYAKGSNAKGSNAKSGGVSTNTTSRRQQTGSEREAAAQAERERWVETVMDRVATRCPGVSVRQRGLSRSGEYVIEGKRETVPTELDAGVTKEIKTGLDRVTFGTSYTLKDSPEDATDYRIGREEVQRRAQWLEDHLLFLDPHTGEHIMALHSTLADVMQVFLVVTPQAAVMNPTELEEIFKVARYDLSSLGHQLERPLDTVAPVLTERDMLESLETNIGFKATWQCVLEDVVREGIRQCFGECVGKGIDHRVADTIATETKQQMDDIVKAQTSKAGVVHTVHVDKAAIRARVIEEVMGKAGRLLRMLDVMAAAFLAETGCAFSVPWRQMLEAMDAGEYITDPCSMSLSLSL
ncbi:hypothetical protein KIPB_007720, partial [Kipferlia bialata]